MNTSLLSFRAFGSAVALLIATSAGAATPAAKGAEGKVADGRTAEIDARYESDRAKCLSGNTGQAQSTCLREAGAARDAAKQGQLNDGGNAKYNRNAKERCDALAGDEAKDCRDRMKGEGSVSGSVTGGGILREKVTREPAPADAPASAPSSTP